MIETAKAITMSNETLQSSVKIELTTSLDDWKIIRECYVHSFRRYPLYKYMVPEDSRRDAFLRAYLDANYEVTVGSGQGILLAIRVPCDDVTDDVPDSEPRPMKVVGGVVFLPPSSDGCGWAIGSDEPYWKAYEKYELAKISKEGLERVIRYEAWENEHVGQKASATRIPLWNGLFCAISPEYSSKGLGTTVYKEAIRIMAKHWVKQQLAQKKIKQPPKQNVANANPEQSEEGQNFLGKFVRSISLKQLHRYTLLNHRPLSQAAFTQKSEKNNNCDISKSRNKSFHSTENTQAKVTTKDMMFNPTAPLVVAISHSDRAASFHQANGFHPISRVPFYDEVEGVTPFHTHVLVLDPFRTGRLNELTTGLQSQEKREEKRPSSQLYENLMAAQPDNILVQ